jgi:LysR family transcriptional regulator, mexEF-oprN operon transcriptional activator
MSLVDLSNVDLNLLKAFDALCYEGSVTRAAARLSIGQPAMSHALGRLRQLLDDELFVKTPRGMEPTARAQTLLKPVRAALDQIARALNDGHAFDPRTDLSVFRVGMLDFVAAGLLPGLLTNVNGAAPGVKFELHTIPLRRLNAQLDEGLLDMVVSFALPDAEWQRHEVLLRETHRCVFNERLVQVTDPITFDEFLTVPHLAIAPQGEEVTPVDSLLQSLGRTRRVLASTTDFLLAAYVLHDMAAIATVPACFAECCRLTAGPSREPASIRYARVRNSSLLARPRRRQRQTPMASRRDGIGHERDAGSHAGDRVYARRCGISTSTAP